MPFTVSHVAAILPFVRSPLPPAALAFGSIAPDVPYFVRIGVPREFSHSVWGALSIDLLIGLVAFALWVVVFRTPLLDYSPRWLRERMSPEARWRSERGWLATSGALVVGLVLGSLTHVAWDLFTHDGSLDAIFPVLAGDIGACLLYTSPSPRDS